MPPVPSGSLVNDLGRAKILDRVRDLQIEAVSTDLAGLYPLSGDRAPDCISKLRGASLNLGLRTSGGAPNNRVAYCREIVARIAGLRPATQVVEN